VERAIFTGKEIASSPPTLRNDKTLYFLMKSGSYENPHLQGSIDIENHFQYIFK